MNDLTNYFIISIAYESIWWKFCSLPGMSQRNSLQSYFKQTLTLAEFPIPCTPVIWRINKTRLTQQISIHKAYQFETKKYSIVQGINHGKVCVVDINSRMGWGRSPSDRPAARQPTRELMSTTYTYPWLIPIITWCRQFPSSSTNILLIKSKLKLESRAFVVGVAMSPRNLGGKYRCRPHPRWWKCTRQFFSGKQRVSIELHQSGVIAWRQHRRSCGVCKDWISLAHCPFQRKWRVLHIRYISVLEQVGMSFNGIVYLVKV